MLKIRRFLLGRDDGYNGVKFGNFVSPVVSPGGVKMGRVLITCDDRNNYSTRSKPVICSLLVT